MHIHTKLRFNHLALLSVLTVGLLGLERAAAQKIDANLNGMSDVWELIYGASALPDEVIRWTLTRLLPWEADSSG